MVAPGLGAEGRDVGPPMSTYSETVIPAGITGFWDHVIRRASPGATADRLVVADADLALVGHQPGDGPQQGGLARPVGPIRPSRDLGHTARRRPVSTGRPSRATDTARSSTLVMRPAWPLRRTRAKNGAPKKAVITPMGSSAGAMTVRATRSARIRKAAPPTRLSGTSSRWLGPATSRMVWGTMMPTNPIRPETATAAAVARVAAATRPADPGRPHPEAGGLVVADGEHVDEAPVERMATVLTSAYGTIRTTSRNRRWSAAEDPAVHLPERLGPLLLHVGLDGGEEGGHGHLGQDQGGGRPGPARAPEGVGGDHPGDRAGGGGQRQQVDRARPEVSGP